jgi:hypothetical protein
MNKPIQPRYFRILFASLLILGLTCLAQNYQPQAANLVSVSVTMGNSRFSYRGQVSGTPGSDTIMDVIIDPAIDDYSANANTEITDALKITDTLTFTGATAGDRTITGITDANTISLDSAIATTDETFYLAETSSLTAVFTTNADITAGYFQVLVPAATSDFTDGIPDPGYFDFGSAPVVTCSSTGSHTPGVTTALAGQTGGILPSGTWHVYACPYTTGGTGGTITIGIPTIINPVPTVDHITGVAETYAVIVRNVRSSDNAVIDSTTVKIGAIEAVRVSATVVPSLTFTIEGDDGTSTHCGKNPATESYVVTTASSVPFGEIDTGNFVYAAQKLEVTTNAIGGGIVTTIANDQLGRDGGVCLDKLTPVYTIGSGGADEYECIWDANVVGMSQTAEVDWLWTLTTETGFGYSIENIDSDAPAFEWDDGGADFLAKHFPDAENAAPAHDPETIFGPLTPSNSDSIYMCYRIRPDAVTAAGDYYNYITYTATATF